MFFLWADSVFKKGKKSLSCASKVQEQQFQACGLNVMWWCGGKRRQAEAAVLWTVFLFPSLLSCSTQGVKVRTASLVLELCEMFVCSAGAPGPGVVSVLCHRGSPRRSWCFVNVEISLMFWERCWCEMPAAAPALQMWNRNCVSVEFSKSFWGVKQGC